MKASLNVSLHEGHLIAVKAQKDTILNLIYRLIIAVTNKIFVWSFIPLIFIEFILPSNKWIPVQEFNLTISVHFCTYQQDFFFKSLYFMSPSEARKEESEHWL